MALLHAILRISSAVVGVICLLMAGSLYPDEENRIQSVLEDAWLRLRYRQDEALSLHAAFMREVARLATRYFDRLFGNDLFSIRSLRVSVAYSVAAVGLVGLLMNSGYGANRDPEGAASCAGFGAVFLFAGTIPAIFAPFRFLKTWFILVFAAAWMAASLILTHHTFELTPVERPSLLIVFITFGVIVSSFGCDLLFIVTTRRMLRWAAEMKSFIAISDG